MLGRRASRKTRSGARYSYIHTAVDDHSRFAYGEIHTDEKKETATGFWQRAHAYFTGAGITVERVPTGNGNCYRSEKERRDAFPAGCTPTITTADTPRSQANHPPAASPTSQGNTPRAPGRVGGGPQGPDGHTVLDVLRRAVNELNTAGDLGRTLEFP